MEKERIKTKKLTRVEKENSFELISPVSGIILPLDLSNDINFRRGEMGIGFVMEDFLDDIISAPINGFFIESFDMSTGIVLLDMKKTIYIILKMTGGNKLVHNQGIEIFPQIQYQKIQKGDDLMKLNREYLEKKGYQFQLSISFTKYKKSSPLKYDILYTQTTIDGIVSKLTTIGRVYQVEKYLG